MSPLPEKPHRRTMDLLKGRVSIPGARYFITLCLQRPGSGLTTPLVAHNLADMIAAVFVPPGASLLCATLMPDHVHLLLTLGHRLAIGRLIAKFKGGTRHALPAGTAWQRNFFEHRLRPDDPAGDVARYIFLNPYRKDLLARTACWPFWMVGPDVDFDFLHQLETAGYPPQPWLDAPHPLPFPRRGSAC